MTTPNLSPAARTFKAILYGRAWLAAAAAALALGVGYQTFQPAAPAPQGLLSAQTTVVSLRTHDGQHYVTAEPDGQVVADRTAVGSWEEWTVEPVAGGVALKSAHGRYLCAEVDGSVVANREQVAAWETWRVVAQGTQLSFQSIHGGFLVAELGGGAEVRADRFYLEPGPWETFTGSAPVGGGGGPPAADLSALRVDGTGHWFETLDGTRYDWREITEMALLSRMLRGEAETQVRPLLQWLKAEGLTQTRVLLTLDGPYWTDVNYRDAHGIGAANAIGFSLRAAPDMPGYWEALDDLARLHAEEGLRMRATILGALEAFGGQWDPQVRRDIFVGSVQTKGEAFAVEIGLRLARHPHVLLELANEPAAIGMRESSSKLVALGCRVKQAAPATMLNAGDISGMEFAAFFDRCFDFVDRHVDRNSGIDFFEAVKRMGEDAYRDSQPRTVPAVSGEPVNMGESRLDRRTGDVAPAAIIGYAYGAVTRSRQILPTYHYDGGLYGNIPQDVTTASLRAFRRALDAFPMVDGNRWRGHWGLAQGDYWRDVWPGEDDIRKVEAHVRAGRGPWRAFGIGPWSVLFPEPKAWDWQRNLDAPADRIDRFEDDAFGVGIYRRQ